MYTRISGKICRFVERFGKFKRTTTLLTKINMNLCASLMSTPRLQPGWQMRSAINLWTREMSVGAARHGDEK